MKSLQKLRNSVTLRMMTEYSLSNLRVAGEEIRSMEETHISYVVLTEMHAYKIKKDVSFSFLDFSSIQKRKYFCEQEIKLNRRLTDDVYLGVVSIRYSDNTLIIGGNHGTVVDYAVQMRRIKSDRQMHLMLERDLVSQEQIRAIAKQLVDFHRSAVIHKQKLDLTRMKENFNDVASIKSIIVDGLPAETVEILTVSIEASDNFLEQHTSLLKARIERGMIRDCHGDLHSRNIFLEANPVIFDCIEFNDSFRIIDVLDEIAFFCMDLESEEKWILSKYFVERYQERFPEAFQDEHDLLLFEYYKLYRANVRAKVNALKINQVQEWEKKSEIWGEVKKYLGLMRRYLHAPNLGSVKPN